MRQERRGTATYLYCLVQAREAPSLAQVPPGLPGMGVPRALHAGGSLWIIAASAPLSRYEAGRIERGLGDLQWVSACAMAHEAVVEFFAASAASIPLKLFTLFSTDGRALGHIRRKRAALEGIFRRIAGRQEWGLRVYFDPSHALTRSRRDAAHEAAPRGAGTRFLLRKQEERGRVGRLVRGARAEAGRIFHQLTRHADGARRRTAEAGDGRGSILLDAAFLVPARRVGRFQRLVRSAETRLAQDGYRLTLTGPWPPYNFVGGRP